MSNTSTITARISPALKKALEDKARELERSESYIINKALEAYLVRPNPPAGAVITPLSHLGADSPMHPSHDDWLKLQKR